MSIHIRVQGGKNTRDNSEECDSLYFLAALQCKPGSIINHDHVCHDAASQSATAFVLTSSVAIASYVALQCSQPSFP